MCAVMSFLGDRLRLGKQVGLDPGRIVLDGNPAPPPQRGTQPPQFSAPICVVTKWLDGSRFRVCGKVGLDPRDIVFWMDQYATWYGGRPQSKRHRVAWALGPALLSPQKGAETPPLIFGPCLSWPNCRMDQNATLYGGRPPPRPHCVKWGPSSTLKKGAQSPQFSACVHRGQTAAWIKMPLGMEVGLRQDLIVLNGDPAPPSKRGTIPSIFGICLSLTNGWMDQDATWYGG